MTATATATPHIRPQERLSAWDTRLFVLRGDDRQQLLDQAAALSHRIETAPDSEFSQLAAALASDLAPSGATLAIVATSWADLGAKLRRACDRLGSSQCAFIRDSSGIYFTSQPLFRAGQVAMLFPGEGAQYSGMLQDLCEALPDVEETFAWCNALAEENGRAEDSIRQLFHLPPTATEAERAEAEVKIRRLGPSIFGVLVADMALYRVLNGLGLPVAAMAGHSAGELAALVAAGAIKDDSMFGPKLVGIMDVMQRQEDSTSDVEVALLAVGADHSVVKEIAGSAVGESVIIAMDNCPHQCVAVGHAQAIVLVESALLGRGIVCERLPFQRPYHTALFEPWMQPFRECFADIPFRLPHTPVYSCTTATLFPDDPEAIRQLAVNQWVSPVEFSQTIRSMYDDGIRIFVEVGPRGNLAAFTEDILRGRSFAAIPANLYRKSGPTQINHLVAQLLVHEVPLNLSYLFQDVVADQPGRSSRELPPNDLFAHEKQQSLDKAHVPGQLVVRSDRDAAMNQFLDVMEQFLQVQQSVLQAFLTQPSANPEVIEPAAFSPDDHQPALADEATPGYALIQEICEFEPGQSIIARRTLDLNEDLFADHHTLAGRGVSRIDPGQNGLPVLPMTFSVEAMAEAALLLAPGNVVIAVRNLRLHRWIPFDPDPTTLEVRAAIRQTQGTDGGIEVTASVRDLGNSFLKEGAAKVAAEATLILAPNYPPSPEPRPFVLSDERPCVSTVEDLRRNMFHGPLFQMLQHLGRLGKEGIEGLVEVQPRHGWFRSDPDPYVVLDPVLLDASMHLLGAWHLEQPDWTGRILLPFEIQSLEFFGPAPTAGDQLLVRGHNEQESARHFRHAMEVIRDDGDLWFRMTGAGYWRFYLPFGHVNFFGPKDEYFLCREWPGAVPSEHQSHARCYYLDPPVDLKQPVLRAAGSRVTMTPREQQEFRAWSGSDEELNHWLFGRIVAKDAVRGAWVQRHGEAIFPADIESELRGGRLVCWPRGGDDSTLYPPVAVAVTKGRVAAISGFASLVGIALLELASEESLAESLSQAACQAVASALQISADQVMATSLGGTGEYHVVPIAGALDELTQLATWPMLVQIARDKNWIVATTISPDATP